MTCAGAAEPDDILKGRAFPKACRSADSAFSALRESHGRIGERGQSEKCQLCFTGEESAAGEEQVPQKEDGELVGGGLKGCDASV